MQHWKSPALSAEAAEKDVAAFSLDALASVKARKTNYTRERLSEELTIWLTIDDCLTVTIDGSKRTNYWLRVFIANNITA